MKKLEVIEVGVDLGVIFPPDLLKPLDCQEGDTVFITELTNGFHLRKCTASEAEQSDLQRMP
ncbi:hypothetical protein [Rhodoferax sp. PAMC 29310]|uniref:hypothetical protein n=1 Tax=Rhodoferax sp. PAMC 29310 TaxID=2822760 RepID=UPI001B33C388|nr:hypothetical protein [Rhodoferax sp. PAMC 29310]